MKQLTLITILLILSHCDIYEKIKGQNQKGISKKIVNIYRGNPTATENGEKLFKEICAACHGRDAKGIVGPNLMDKEWLHGDTDSKVYDVIYNGIFPPHTKTNKGPCPAHGISLKSKKIYEIMAWIASKNQSLKAE